MTPGKLSTKCGRIVVNPCLRTSNAWDRMRGLLFRDAPQAGAGLLIDPCSSVHTFAMSYPIDVVYLNRDFQVVKTITKLNPWRVSACKTASMTLELAGGQADSLELVPTLELQWQGA
jgi:uncharacterized membrane protein (UPF0127 family)